MWNDRYKSIIRDSVIVGSNQIIAMTIEYVIVRLAFVDDYNVFAPHKNILVRQIFCKYDEHNHPYGQNFTESSL